MDCFANTIPFWKGLRKWLGFTKATPQDQEIIIFADVERGPDDLMVTFLRSRFYDRLPWGEFKELGSSATLAVVKAGWNCFSLDQLAESIREGRFKDSDLNKARKRAKDKRKNNFSRSPSDPISRFG
ncbi:uncharacterized protein ACLA_091480 [Aspergillus clavatus NRRL 1]|uniref:Uncharacterized protein n=1 Tax=Aspergillus clavatus (strain ATCC 1007 / CBS 513.65 / DSM 816 / NCTC 3887 / NRRL 1 / QM 1276 / 107) TaxID=344612 RepID=A1CF01_ASPCL|nr:uncharacterized protein ACLA_091480 [Aspergillus clavatus NRRL 1]EAW11450.1 hypothetical protein ACLA_091480 [Aspergillus clavatus NRRL 1]